MADKSIKLLFEVDGGGSISGASGATIQGQIANIVSEISKNTTRLQFKADPASLKSLREDVKNSLKDIEVTVKTRERPVAGGTSAATGSGGAKSQSDDITNKQKAAAAKKELQSLLKVYEATQTGLNNAVKNGNTNITYYVEEAEKAYKAYADAVTEASKATNGLIKEETEMAAIDAKRDEFMKKRDMASHEYLTKLDAESLAIEQKINALEVKQQEELRGGGAYKEYVSALEALKADGGINDENILNYTRALANFNNELKNTKPAATAAATDIAKLQTQIEDLLTKANKPGDKSALTSLLNELSKGDVSKTRFKEIIKEVNELAKSVAASQPKVKSFGDVIQRLFTMFGGQYLFIRAVREMVKSVRELDASLTQMRIVTHGTEEEIDNFAETVAKDAKDIGSSITNLVESATVYARLGYSEGESATLAKYTSMLSNIGNIDVSVAQDSMTAIVKAFRVNVDDIEHIMDEMVAVGNHFPISVQEIAQGMANAGSALQAGGNTFEQSVALLTAANTTIQNISKSSTGLRTITARIRKVKVELDDLGEVVETAKYQEIVDMLTGKGIKLTENGEFRATYDIIKDIAGIWDSLTSMEQAGVIEQFAGTRQQNVFLSLVGQFREAEGAMRTMSDSAGEMSKAFDIYMGSIEARVGVFKAAFQELAQTTIDSGFINSIINLGTSILEGLNPVAEFLGKFFQNDWALGFTAFAAAFVTGMAQINSTVAKFTAAKTAMAGGNIFNFLIELTRNKDGAISGLGAIFKKLSDSAEMLKMAWEDSASAGNVFARVGTTIATSFTAAQLAIAGTIAVIGALAAAMKIYSDYQKKKREEADSEAKTSDEEAKRLSYLVEEYKAIKQQQTISKADNERIAAIQKEINELIGAESAGINLVNGSLDEQIDKLREIAILQASNSLPNSVVNYGYKSNDFTSWYNRTYAYGSGDIDKAQRAVDILRKSGVESEVNLYKSISQGPEAFKKALEDTRNALKENQKLYNDIDSALGLDHNLILAWIETTISDINTAQSEVIDAGNQVITEAALSNAGDLKERFERIYGDADPAQYAVKFIDDLYKSMRRDSGVKNAFDDLVRDGFMSEDDIKDMMVSAIANVFPEIVDAYNAIKQKAAEESGEIAKPEPIKSSDILDNEEITTGFKDLEDNVKTLQDILRAISDEDYDLEITDELTELIQKFPELKDAVGDFIATGDKSSLIDAIKTQIGNAPDTLITKLEALGENATAGARNAIDKLIAKARELGEIPVDSFGDKFEASAKQVSNTASTLATAIGNVTGLTKDQYDSLVKANGAFADAIEFNGNSMSVNADKAGQILDGMVNDYVLAVDKQIAADNARIEELIRVKGSYEALSEAEKKEVDTLRNNVNQYRVIRTELQNVTSAYQKWIRAQGTANQGEMFDGTKKALEYINEVLTDKKSELYLRWNTDDFLSALELVSGNIDQFMDENGQLDIEAVLDFKNNVSQYFSNGKEGIANFFGDLVDHEIASIDDGVFKIESKSLQYIADEMNMGKDAILSLFKLAEEYGYHVDYSDDEFAGYTDTVKNNLEEIQAIAEETGTELNTSATDAESVFSSVLGDANNTLKQRLDLMQKISDLEGKKKVAEELGDRDDVANYDAMIQKLTEDLNNLPTLKTVDIELYQSALEGEIARLENEKLSLPVGADTSDIDSRIEELNERLSNIPVVIDNATVAETETKLSAVKSVAEQVAVILSENYTLDVNTSSAYSRLQIVSNTLSTIISRIREINNTPITTGGTNITGGTVGVNGSGLAAAGGGYIPLGGKTLVGELGQEMYVDPNTNTWHTVGDNGAEFVKLPPHAIVFNHRQTRSLLGTGRSGSRGRSMLSGNAKVSVISKIADDIVKSWKKKQNGNQGSRSKSKNSSESSKSFEEMYDEHQHLLAMEQESMEDYLKWLDNAYQEAYKRGEITLDDFRKYQEEVFKGLKDLFKDYIDDIQFAIDELSRGDNMGKEIMSSYDKILVAIEKELQAAYDRGLKDTDDYVQELKKMFWQYYDARQKYEEQSKENAKDSVDELIRYRIRMIEKELNEEKKAINERLSYLKDFYNNQKELLSEAVEEEDYIREQQEKRKKISDLQMSLDQLALDNSARAQKRRIELEEQLREAQEELRIFERDHAVKMAQDELDSIYEEQSKAAEEETKLIDEKLENQKYLYDTALEDIRNNTMELYEEMKSFNERYVDGTTEAIETMWENAYKSLQEYKALFDEWYKDIQLINATGYTSGGTGSTPGRPYASGTKHATSGVHRVNERGLEHVFVAADGSHYRLFSGGEKVLDAKSTNFLYNFAKAGGSVVGDAIRSLFPSVMPKVPVAAGIGDVRMGDIIIQGNASDKTVSEIRRAQRDSIDYILKEFRKLNK